MPHLDAPARARFADSGPFPQALSVGPGMAVMLLCLRPGHELRAPEGDTAETVFIGVSGRGVVLDGDMRHPLGPGQAVHVLPGRPKALIGQDEDFVVMGVRRLGGS